MEIEFLVRDLLGSNCRIDSASNGRMVLKQLKLVTYDILISDISMPDTDGLEMITSALALQPGLKILIVSVYSESIFAHSYLRAGAFGYVQKGESNEDQKRQ